MIRTATAIKRIKQMGFEAFDSVGYGAIVLVSAEHGDDAADYYGEYRGGYPWINPKLEEFAKKNGCYWEWCHPGAIALYEA